LVPDIENRVAIIAALLSGSEKPPTMCRAKALKRILQRIKPPL